MSYSSPRRRKFGLGAAALVSKSALSPKSTVSKTSVSVLRPASSPMAAPLSAGALQQRTLDIVPPSCAALRLDSLGASQGPAANQVAVMAWPYVKLDEAAVTRVLDGIYGAGAGGDAVLRAGVESAVPNFVASGWMPDPVPPRNGLGAGSRGTLWVAFGWPTAMSARDVKSFALRVLSPLVGLPISQAGSASEGFGGLTPMGIGGIPKVADDKSDVGLQNAAVRSASATVGFIAAFGAALLGAGPLAKATAATQTTRTFNAALAKLDAALATIASVGTLVGQAAAISEAVRNATPETCAAAVAPADATVAALNAAKLTLVNVRGAPEAILQYVRTETNPDASDFVRQIRDEVVAQVNTAMPPGTQLAITREYMKCLVWQNAKRALDAQVGNMVSRLADAANKAVAILGMGDAITAAFTQIDAAILGVQQAKDQSCLGWFEKDFYGVSRSIWVGGSLATFLAIAVAVKARRKRAAAKVAAPVTPNRHRTSRRVR